MLFVCIKKGQLLKGLIGAIVFVLIGGICLFFNFRSSTTGVFNSKRLPIYSVDTKEKKIALTFDASWREDNTDEILAVLDKYDVRATFFLVGTWVDANEDKLKAMNKSGHEIGNHTNSHANMNTISKESLIKEIEILDGKIRAITGHGTELFRCPSGDYNDNVIDTVQKLNKYCIQWDVDSIDWKNEGAEIEYNRIINKTKPGSILLFHNDAKYTPQNLPLIIEHFKDQGYKFVTVSELIYKSDFVIDSQGKQIYKK